MVITVKWSRYKTISNTHVHFTRRCRASGAHNRSNYHWCQMITVFPGVQISSRKSLSSKKKL